MGYPTPIEWCDATWNPIGGCSIKSPGCAPCYAQALAGTRLKDHPLYAGTTDLVKGKPVFNGHLTVLPDDHPGWLWPLKWKGASEPVLGPGRPSTIFVGDMSDLHHEDRPLAHVDKVAAVAALSKHTLQLLTKRADRMAHYWTFTPNRDDLIARAAVHLGVWADADAIHDQVMRAVRLPLPNVWLGFSAERQKEFDERWEHMKRLAAAGWIVFVSIEPMIGPVVLPADFLAFGDRVWVICGGMSGNDAKQRPTMHPDWPRALRDQCAAAGVPFFFKQWGEWQPTIGLANTHMIARDGSLREAGGPIQPGERGVRRVGKKAAGRLLDGVEQSAFPLSAAPGQSPHGREVG